MFSIIIPTYNNLEYLKILITSLEKNSKYKHEIILHINEGTDGTLEYVNSKKFVHTYTKNNVGMCTAVNLAAAKATTEYILYSHDDMYFCPGWDEVLSEEISKLNTQAYYLSGTMIEKSSGYIQLDCGNDFKDFDEDKLLKKFNQVKFYDYQGSHWAPHLIHVNFWKKVGGFSEEFNPGITSDPDLNMKLWKSGVRIFKGLNKFRVYHFGSITTRKKKELTRNRGDKIFLIKWGISSNLFTKYYLNTGRPYDGPLKNKPNVSIRYLIELIRCKIKFFLLKFF